jgi:HEAT repeat protein
MNLDLPTSSDPVAIPSWEECLSLLDRLPSLAAEARTAAVERLVRNPRPGLREQVLRIGASVLADDRLIAYLRDDGDAVLRNAASEILRLRGGRSLPLVVGLLRDPEPDVVLQAVLILDRLHDPRALEPLHGVLAHPDPNVQQEAILAIGRLGDARSVPYLLPFLDAEPWVQMAATQALGDLRSTEAVLPLAARLRDELIGPLAAESLARIGGEAALAALTRPWPPANPGLDDEVLAGLLAHVLEGIPADRVRALLPRPFPSLLAERFAGGSDEQRTALARCLLMLGPSASDEAALATLAARTAAGGAAGGAAAGVLPAALAGRHDLTEQLLGQRGAPGGWGFLLAARYPDRTPAGAFRAALGAAGLEDEQLPALVQALATTGVPGVGEPLLDLYLRSSTAAREALEPALARHRREILEAIQHRPALDGVDRLVLSAQTGAPAGELLAALLALPAAACAAAVGRLLGCEELVRTLPWERWITGDPAAFSPLAAAAAGRYSLHPLAPALRRQAADAPSVPLLRALGELADRAAVPLLVSVLAHRPELRLVALESLGKIGGAEARAALRAAVEVPLPPPAGGTELRVAHRALAGCATEDEESLFLAAAGHADWYVRLAAVDGLSRMTRPAATGALGRLAGDPVQAVAHRALAALESCLGREG